MVSKKSEVLAHLIRVPGPNDVKFGRGGGMNQSSGNVKFRELVRSKKYEYNVVAQTKAEKVAVTEEVFATVRDRGGRFLQRAETMGAALENYRGSSNWWVEVSHSKALAKTSQALREGAQAIKEEARRRGEMSDAGASPMPVGATRPGSGSTRKKRRGSSSSPGGTPYYRARRRVSTPPATASRADAETEDASSSTRTGASPSSSFVPVDPTTPSAPRTAMTLAQNFESAMGAPPTTPRGQGPEEESYLFPPEVDGGGVTPPLAPVPFHPSEAGGGAASSVAMAATRFRGSMPLLSSQVDAEAATPPLSSVPAPSSTALSSHADGADAATTALTMRPEHFEQFSLPPPARVQQVAAAVADALPMPPAQVVADFPPMPPPGRISRSNSLALSDISAGEGYLSGYNSVAGEHRGFVNPFEDESDILADATWWLR